MRPGGKILKWFLIPLVSLVLSVVLAVVIFWQTKIRPLEKKLFGPATPELLRIMEALEKDNLELAGEPFFGKLFGPGPQQRDAGVYLNPNLSWKLPDATSTPATWQLPEDMKAQIRKLNEADWLFQFSTLDKNDGDYSDWLRQLAEFDHWRLDENSPLAEAVKNDPKFDVLDGPRLDLVFIDWAKYHLMRSDAENRLAAGLLEVQKLAFLMLTAENLIMSLSAMRLLEIERQAYEQYRKNFPDGVLSEYEALGAETLQKARRAMVAATHFFQISVPPELIQRYYASPEKRLGICAGLEAQIAPMKFAEIWLRDSYPDRFQTLDDALAKTKGTCRLDYLRKHWERTDFVPYELEEDIFQTVPLLGTKEDDPQRKEKSNAVSWKVIQSQRWLKKWIGLILMQIVASDQLQPYRN